MWLVARFAYINFLMVFYRKLLGCLCANIECDSSSSPADNGSQASPRIRAPARIPAAATAAVGHADSAHSLNHRRRVTAAHKEGFTGHDAVISWLEKADDPSHDDHVSPVRKEVCYYFLYDEASPTHTNVPGPPCMPPAGHGSIQMSTHHCVPLTLLGVADGSCISLL